MHVGTHHPTIDCRATYVYMIVTCRFHIIILRATKPRVELWNQHLHVTILVAVTILIYQHATDRLSPLSPTQLCVEIYVAIVTAIPNINSSVVNGPTIVINIYNNIVL